MRQISEALMERIRAGDRRAFSRKLTEKHVAQMRRDFGKVAFTEKGYLKRRSLTLEEIGAMYGVGRNCVSKILRGETWRHVP